MKMDANAKRQVENISQVFQDSDEIALSALRLMNNRCDDLGINTVIAAMIAKRYLEAIIDDMLSDDKASAKIITHIVNMGTADRIKQTMKG